MTSFLMNQEEINDETEEFDLMITNEDDLNEIIISGELNKYYRKNLAFKGISIFDSTEDSVKTLLSNTCPKSLYFKNCYFSDFKFLHNIDEYFEKISVIECDLDTYQAMKLISYLPSEQEISVDLSGNKIGLYEKVFFDFIKPIIFEPIVFKPLILKNNKFTEKGISNFKDFLKQYYPEEDFITFK